MKFGIFAAVAALTLSAFAGTSNAQHITRTTDKSAVIELLAPYVEVFDKALAHPIGIHYRAVCKDWQQGTTRPADVCTSRRAMLVKRALLGSVICKVYVEELKKMDSNRVWATARITQDDLDFNNRAVDACVVAGQDIKPMLNEQL